MFNSPMGHLRVVDLTDLGCEADQGIEVAVGLAQTEPAVRDAPEPPPGAIDGLEVHDGSESFAGGHGGIIAVSYQLSAFSKEKEKNPPRSPLVEGGGE